MVINLNIKKTPPNKTMNLSIQKTCSGVSARLWRVGVKTHVGQPQPGLGSPGLAFSQREKLWLLRVGVRCLPACSLLSSQRESSAFLYPLPFPVEPSLNPTCSITTSLVITGSSDLALCFGWRGVSKAEIHYLAVWRLEIQDQGVSSALDQKSGAGSFWGPLGKGLLQDSLS